MSLCQIRLNEKFCNLLLILAIAVRILVPHGFTINQSLSQHPIFTLLKSDTIGGFKSIIEFHTVVKLDATSINEATKVSNQNGNSKLDQANNATFKVVLPVNFANYLIENINILVAQKYFCFVECSFARLIFCPPPPKTGPPIFS